MREIFLLLCWTFVGIINFCSKDISKVDYGLCWFTLMITLLMNVMVGG